MKRWIAVVTMVVAFGSVASAQVVHFNDANLKEAVKGELGITRDPTAADMLGLTHLNANSSDIADLTGLEYARNLEKIWLYDNQISDLSPLASLTKLTDLGLAWNQITDLSPWQDCST